MFVIFLSCCLLIFVHVFAPCICVWFYSLLILLAAQGHLFEIGSQINWLNKYFFPLLVYFQFPRTRSLQDKFKLFRTAGSFLRKGERAAVANLEIWNIELLSAGYLPFLVVAVLTFVIHPITWKKSIKPPNLNANYFEFKGMVHRFCTKYGSHLYFPR